MGRLTCNHYLFHYPSRRVITDFHVIVFVGLRDFPAFSLSLSVREGPKPTMASRISAKRRKEVRSVPGTKAQEDLENSCDKPIGGGGVSCASPPSVLTHALCTHAQTRPRTKTEQGSQNKRNATGHQRVHISTWSAEHAHEKQERGREGRTEIKQYPPPNNCQI